VIERPRGLEIAEPRQQALAELVTMVTEAPWTLSRALLSRSHAAGLSDADVLHAIVLSSYFGHLNRVADAVGVPLDYDVTLPVPAVDPTVPARAPAHAARVGRPAIELALRPDTARALVEWRTYAFYRDQPLTRRQRTYMARCVAQWIGDGGISAPGDLTGNPLDDALYALASTVTLAPWQLGPHSFAALRGHGFDDAALFDVVATTAAAGVFSRIEVARIALGS
jgi:alkylhydroperoxidase family enzyme